MPTQQLLDRVRELREAGRTPKEIARALKMPPSAVASPFARDLALDLQPPDPGPCVYLSYWTWAVSVIRL
jgi:hypothetical protein